MPFPTEHSCRLSPPENYEKFRRGKRKHEGKEYGVIYGKLKDEDKWEDQAYRYDKEVWEAADAKTHCKDHDGTFEAAKEDTFKCECIECGHKLTSKKHCSEIKCPECGGEMRREERPGPGKSEQSKAGRVLSATSLEKVRAALNALQALLEAAEKEPEPEKSTLLSEAEKEAAELETVITTLKAENEGFDTKEAEERIEAILEQMKNKMWR